MQRKTPMDRTPCTPLSIKASAEESTSINDLAKFYPEDKDLDIETLQQLECELNPRTLRRLISLFVAETWSHLANIAAAQAAGDSQRMRREAHTLKSAAGSFGAPRLRRHAWLLDRCCADGDWDGIHTLATSITDVASPALQALTRQYLAPANQEARSEMKPGSPLNSPY
jgi:HPt (histidine-containing phosphotransfer) domain-containing protein